MMPPEAVQLLERFNRLGDMLPHDPEQVRADPIGVKLLIAEMQRIDTEFLKYVDQAKRDYQAQLAQQIKPVTLRSRKSRERKAAGRLLLCVEVDEVDHCELLIRAGLLSALSDHSRTDIERATQKFLAVAAAESEGST